MKTAKKMMTALAVMVMAVMVLPNTSAKAAKTPLKKNVYLAINDGENDKISKKTAKYTLKLKGVSKKAVKKAKWSSASKKIATVSKKGVVKGKKHGSTKITCKVGKTKYTCTVHVNDIQKVIKNYTMAMYSGLPTWVSTSKYEYTHNAYEEGKISANEVSDSLSFHNIGDKVYINGHWYFFYHERWYKKYAHIKEGRLNSKNVWAKCNQDPEYKKAQAEAKAKEDAEAAKAIREGEAKKEAEAKVIEESNAKAEALRAMKEEAETKVSEYNQKVLEALEAFGFVNVVYSDDGNGMGMSWNSQEASEAYDEWCSERKKALEEITAAIDSKWAETNERAWWEADQEKAKTVEALITLMDSKMDEISELYDAWVAEQDKALEEELAWVQSFYDEWEAYQKEQEEAAEAAAKEEAEKQAQMEAEEKAAEEARIQAQIQEREDTVKEALAAGAIVTIDMPDGDKVGHINIYRSGSASQHITFSIRSDEERESIEKLAADIEIKKQASRQERENLIKEAEAVGAKISEWTNSEMTYTITTITYPDGTVMNFQSWA